MSNRQRRRLADMHRIHVGLRDVDVRPKGSGLCDPVEQRIARTYERADVHIAQRDHAVERRLDQPIALELLQAGQVRLGRRQIAALRQDRLLQAPCTLASCAASCARD